MGKKGPPPGDGGGYGSGGNLEQECLSDRCCHRPHSVRDRKPNQHHLSGYRQIRLKVVASQQIWHEIQSQSLNCDGVAPLVIHESE